ncbi:MAG: glycosyl hydrolase, partial [Pseudomonadota bacterium]
VINEDWTFTLGGDGFKPQIDPEDPSIIYSQYQYGGLARYDMKTGNAVYIAPQPGPGEPALRWNWNAPLIISPHDPARLYYGAEKLFRSDDRGDSWEAISANLTRNLDRNELEVEGRIWSVDAVAKNRSTSVYGSIVALDESPVQEGLLYAGSDDGLIQISEDGGASWHAVSSIIGVPTMSLVEDLVASLHDDQTVFAVFDNHKRGDFRPYVFKSSDRGRTWKSITGNLPERGTAHTIVQDHVDPELLFVGTEFGLYFTQDGGQHWSALKAGLPTIAVRDLEIQRRESDLVVASFGRGIYLLDDYSPLRTKHATLMEAQATLFPVKDPWAYHERYDGDSPGASRYAAPNPTFGAVFTYHLKDGYQTLRATRRDAERKLEATGADTPYPTWDALRAEDRELAPTLVLTIRDDNDQIVRRLTAPASKGLHRVAWDLRLPPADPVNLKALGERPPWAPPPAGPMALPGPYSVTLAVRQGDELKPLAGPERFTVKLLDQGGLVADDLAAVQAFQLKTHRLQRAVDGAVTYLGEMEGRIAHLRGGFMDTLAPTAAQLAELRTIELALADLKVLMQGDRTIASRAEPAPWPITSRVASVVYGHWDAFAPVTGTHAQAYQIAAQEFTGALGELKRIDGELRTLEADAERLAVPYTPGRLPNWQPE